MPVPLLIALLLAFGTETILPPSPVSREAAISRVAGAGAEVAGVGLVALAFGLAVAHRVRRLGRATRGDRRALAAGSKVVGALTLIGYGWVVLGLGWPDVVRSGLGLRDSILADEILILLPYVLALVAGWLGLYPAERAIRAGAEAGGRRPIVGVGRHLVLKARQTLGMVLPATLIFSLGQDLARARWPGRAEDPGFQMTMMAAMGALTLALAPAFVRLSWPTRTLPVGPLRDRLERVARRFGFRCTDILIWDTEGAVVNAGVTGALPWFRYVLLTDALIAGLNEHEVAAVFGHEVGHVRHRHLAFFGFFFVASMGVLALAGDLVSGRLPKNSGLWPGPAAMMVVEGLAVLALAVAYFGSVFGLLSRRFERQADVFGCRAVSCDRVDCPPHPDLYHGRSAEVPAGGPICPVGIRIFVNALMSVALLNGMEPAARSWRHGSINRRVAFLEGLEGRPEAERRFQAGTARLRLALVLGLLGALALAFHSGAIEHLGP